MAFDDIMYIKSGGGLIEGQIGLCEAQHIGLESLQVVQSFMKGSKLIVVTDTIDIIVEETE